VTARAWMLARRTARCSNGSSRCRRLRADIDAVGGRSRSLETAVRAPVRLRQSPAGQSTTSGHGETPGAGHSPDGPRPLTNPTAHGASAQDVFHLVIPSLPGHGFSAKATTTGWDPSRIARAWVVLMKRLGYTRFVAQNGDGVRPSRSRWVSRRRRSCWAFTRTCPARGARGGPLSARRTAGAGLLEHEHKVVPGDVDDRLHGGHRGKQSQPRVARRLRYSSSWLSIIFLTSHHVAGPSIVRISSLKAD
jgi:hypothetical protein